MKLHDTFNENKLGEKKQKLKETPTMNVGGFNSVTFSNCNLKPAWISYGFYRSFHCSLWLESPPPPPFQREVSIERRNPPKNCLKLVYGKERLLEKLCVNLTCLEGFFPPKPSWLGLTRYENISRAVLNSWFPSSISWQYYDVSKAILKADASGAVIC